MDFDYEERKELNKEKAEDMCENILSTWIPSY